nr:hypothetical protein [Pseudomonas sp.]
MVRNNSFTRITSAQIHQRLITVREHMTVRPRIGDNFGKQHSQDRVILDNHDVQENASKA